MHLTSNGCVVTQSLIQHRFYSKGASRFGLKCSRTNVYAPLLNRIDALSLNVIYYF